VLRPLAVAAAAAIVVIALVLVLPGAGPNERPAPVTDSGRLEFHVSPPGAGVAQATARVLRERLTVTGVRGASVAAADDGSRVTVTSPADALPDVLALARRGRAAIYDWEASVLGPDGRPAPSDLGVTGGPTPGRRDGGMTKAQADELASRPSGGRPVRGEDGGWFVLGGTPALTDFEIERAHAITTPAGEPAVAIEFTARGQAAFTTLTREIARRGRARAADGVPENQAWQHLVLAIDDQIIAVPQINGHENPNGINGANRAQIQGGLTPKTARQIAAMLDSGPLPAALSRAG
jgi:hypothetical protein